MSLTEMDMQLVEWREYIWDNLLAMCDVSLVGPIWYRFLQSIPDMCDVWYVGPIIILTVGSFIGLAHLFNKLYGV